MPARRSRSAVAGPTPGITVTCIGRSRSCSVPGATTTRPSGLSRSLATLAMNFEVPMPTDAVSPPVTSWTRGRSSLGDAGAPSPPRGRAGRPRRGRRTPRRATAAPPAARPRASTLHHRAAGLAVGVEAAGEERGVRAPRPRLAGRHRRAHAVPPRLVRRRGHHAAAADAADDDRLAAQRRLVALLDRGEERVEVEVEHRRVGAHGRNVLARHRRARCGTSTGRRSRLVSPQPAAARVSSGPEPPGTVRGMSDDRRP